MKNIAVFLFDLTGIMAEPWRLAGYECWLVDTQHPAGHDSEGITSRSAAIKLNGKHRGPVHSLCRDLGTAWLPPFDRQSIAFVAAFPPCDHLAVSGARWFKGKGLRKLAKSIELFATAAEFCEWSGAPYMIENPVSNIASHWRKSDYRFSPHHFTGYDAGDNYTKKTCLWTGGGFVMPHSFADDSLGEPDDRIHKCPPGPNRHNMRSATPPGFARAVFNSNARPGNAI